MKTKIEITKKQIQHNNYNNKLTRGRKMKYFIITVMTMAGLFAQDQPAFFNVNQSTVNALYFILINQLSIV